MNPVMMPNPMVQNPALFMVVYGDQANEPMDGRAAALLVGGMAVVLVLAIVFLWWAWRRG
ncbi:hypothetical protein SEA_GOIB_76 [Gordonia phage Goib]|uniref:Uncharacterized protein n=2 Tax=Vendettavirus vendetta TaxID=2049886 RepID=A0A166Y4C0_9CAUD|nr:hypothetical protein BH795_gp35 [Gordonia phage Vendetta]YP_009275430.1 hypothetical protein BH760_gp35 [Gordonia phage Splinter]ANA85623.1 hypothetical protein PBI_VENDETTA_76 [Gordonia phage Vendetta]ANA85702.1 hypothetical protein PBI_SPLINTER_76 [Gordonia phage Splinter]WNO25818.1 hypothetical protein SEA_GOIB_76 [Gordonia phage Goib]